MKHPTGNPALESERLRNPAPVIVYLEPAHVRAQLEALSDRPALRAAAAVMIYAGLRLEETCWLTIDDADVVRGALRVRAKVDPMSGAAWQPKTRSNRSVPISEDLRAELSPWLRARGVAPGWLIPTPTGVRWCPCNLARRIREANREAGCPAWWGPRTYRHTFGSLCAQNTTLSLFQIAALMGNSHVIAERHYASIHAATLGFDVGFMRTPEAPRTPPSEGSLRLTGAG